VGAAPARKSGVEKFFGGGGRLAVGGQRVGPEGAIAFEGRCAEEEEVSATI
jgi:hypothetical protein